MRFLNKIKEFFFKNKTKKIGEAKKVDKDVIVFPIELIIKIIKNEDKMYDAMKKADKEANIFDTGFTKSQYIDAIISYVRFANQIGIQFTKEELKRLRKLTGVRIKNSNLKNDEIKIEHDLYELFVKICNDDNMAEDFSKINNEDDYKKWGKIYNINIPYKEIKSKHFKKFWEYMKKIEPHNNATIRLKEVDTDNYRKIYFKYSCTPIDLYEIKLNEELKAEVMKNIPDKLDKISMALAIYVELNKVLNFDYGYHALNGSYFNTEVLDMFFKDPNDVSLVNNRVICYIWSKIYAQLIQEKIPGVRAYIWDTEDYHPNDPRERMVNGVKTTNFYHRFVYIVDDNKDNGFVIKADATNPFTNKNDKTRANDLERAKLGWEPAGIEIEKSKEEVEISDIYESMGYKFYGLWLKDEAELAKDVDELKELLGKDTSLIKKLLGIKDNNRESIDYKKIDFFLKLVLDLEKNNSNLDPSTIYYYMSNIKYFIFGKNDYIKMIDCYKKEDDGKYMSYPLVRFNLGSIKKPNYKYIIYEKGKGFYNTSCPKLKDKEFIVEDYNMEVIVEKRYLNKKDNIETLKRKLKDEYGEEMKTRVIER